MNVPKHSPRVSEYPVWLAVPHEAREAVRAAAGKLENGQSAIKWDKEASLWFARPGCDLSRVSEWLPDPSRRAGGGDPETQFLDALTQAGLVINGMPIMDGERHRVATVEDKHGKQSGVYKGFLDRRPGGWFVNYHRAPSHRDITNWAATGGESDPSTRLHIRAGARQAQDDAVRKREATYAERTLAAKSLYDRLPAADPSHPYLVRKGITPTPELRETRNGALVVPFFNAAGEFKTLQYIPPEGEKFLFKDAPKQGHYLVVGGTLEPGQPVFYAEGYATARSLSMATGNPVVMAVDAGNMLEVAKVLGERFPDSQHVFMADFDHAKDENKGLQMATAAAELVGGQVHYPAFTDAEKAQGFTDYNDLHLSRGLDALRNQVARQLVRPTEEMTMSDDRTTATKAQEKSYFLVDSQNGRIWTGQEFKASTDIGEAQGFTHGEVLKAALQLEHAQRETLRREPVEIRQYLPVIEQNVKVIDTDKAKSWPELSAAFQKRGVEITRESYDATRTQVAAGIAQSNRQGLDAKAPAEPQSPDQPVERLRDLPAPAVAITQEARATLEREWTALQSNFIQQKVELAQEFKEDLHQALKAEHADLKQQLVEEGKDQSFGKRIALAVGVAGYSETQTQAGNLDRALKQLDKAEQKGSTEFTFDGRQAQFQEWAQADLERGRANSGAVGELSKDRAVWVNEQAVLRMGADGLAPPLPLAKAETGGLDAERSKRVEQVVEQAKANPWDANYQAIDFAIGDAKDLAVREAKRFSQVDLQASNAIDTRAQIFESVAAPSGVPAAVASIEPNDLREWARMDSQDAAKIQDNQLRGGAVEILKENAQSVPVYAQTVEVPSAQAPAAEPPVSVAAPTAVPVPDVKPDLSTAADPVAPAPVNAPPPIASVETAPAAQPANGGNDASLAIAEPAPVAIPISAPAQPFDTDKDFVPFDAKPDASNTAGPVTPVPENAPPPIASVETAPAVQTATPAGEPSLAIADPVQAPAAPAMPTAAAVADKDVVDETPAALQPAKPEPATAKEEVPAPGTEAPEPAFLPKKVVEDLSANAEPDAIVLGPPRPRGGDVEPQATNIDKDTLLARVTSEILNDREALYKLDGQPAFKDLGSRLEMVDGASKNDEMVVAALLMAAQYYRGRIELTGSDEFKEKAIGLIAQHQLNLEMKNPAQQAMLYAARTAVNAAPEARDAVTGEMTPAQRAPEPAQAPIQHTASPQPAQSASQVMSQSPQQAPVSASYQPLDVPDIAQPARQPAAQQAVAQQPVAVPTAAIEPMAPVGPGNQVHYSQAPQPMPAPATDAAQQAPTGQRISPAIHQPFQAAKEGVTGKVLASGPAPFRFEEGNAESTFIKLRTKIGIETFWGKELAGLLRDTRVQHGSLVTLQWLGKEPVTIKAPIKDEHGVTVRFEDKQAHRNQWSMQVGGNPAVRTGQDEGVKLHAYDAGRFALVQNALIAQLGVEVPALSPPKEGLYWLTPNGQGSAKAGDELSAPRPAVDPNHTAGKPVISSWTQDGHLDAYLVRGDGAYLQGVARQGNEYQHVLVSLPGRDDAPPMVFNAITPEGLVPIGTGNGINRSGGQSVSREHIAFKLEGDDAVRIGKLDAPGEVPPKLHARLGFDERWKEDNALPKSAPTPAPSAQPSEPRPAV